MPSRKKYAITVVVVAAMLFIPVLIAQWTPDSCPVRDAGYSDQFPPQSAFHQIGKSYAVSQWTRKYKTPCSSCHTVFPRLNYYGEQFMRNGFQDPDDLVPDGDTKRKNQYDNTFIGRLGDYFGARVSVQPLKYQTKGLTENGSKTFSLDIGEANWLQFFTAGTVGKNVSYFNELEIDDGGTVKHGWFVLGFHNLFKTKAVNFQIGKISPVEWTSFSNRLRIFPEMKGFADKISSSSRAPSGAAEDSVNISSSQYGMNYYGYAGPMIWALGVGNGSHAIDVNQEKNAWASVRFDITNEASSFVGSSISMFAYQGKDTATTSTVKVSNTSRRYQPSFNIRWNEKLDVIGSFHYGTEDNIGLVANPVSDSYWGITGIVSYMITPKWQIGSQYDTIRQKKNANLEDDRLALHVSHLLRENINLIVTGDTELTKPKRLGTKNHQVYATVRMMF